jgi:hypothetical protein
MIRASVSKKFPLVILSSPAMSVVEWIQDLPIIHTEDFLAVMLSPSATLRINSVETSFKKTFRQAQGDNAGGIAV